MSGTEKQIASLSKMLASYTMMGIYISKVFGIPLQDFTERMESGVKELGDITPFNAVAHMMMEFEEFAEKVEAFKQACKEYK